MGIALGLCPTPTQRPESHTCSGAFVICEVAVTDIYSLPLQVQPLAQQLATALDQVRKSRHQDGCMCHAYRRNDELFCTEQEATWSQSVDRLLTSIRRVSF